MRSAPFFISRVGNEPYILRSGKPISMSVRTTNPDRLIILFDAKRAGQFRRTPTYVYSSIPTIGGQADRQLLG